MVMGFGPDEYCENRPVGGCKKGPERHRFPRAMNRLLPKGRTQKELRAQVLAHLPPALTDFAQVRVAIREEMRDGGMEFAWEMMAGGVSILRRPDAIAPASWEHEDQHFAKRFAACWSETQRAVVETMVVEAGGQMVPSMDGTTQKGDG